MCSIGGKETEEERRLRKEKSAAKKEAKKEKKMRDKETKKSKKAAKHPTPISPQIDAPRKSLEPARGEVLAELEPRHSLDGGNLKLPPPGEHLFSDDLRSLVRLISRRARGDSFGQMKPYLPIKYQTSPLKLLYRHDSSIIFLLVCRANQRHLTWRLRIFSI